MQIPLFLKIILITLIPTLELRASIPYGILRGMPWFSTFMIAVIANIALGLMIYLFIEELVLLLYKIKIFKKFWHAYVERTRRKIHKFTAKYGALAVAVFIAIPLPGSGVYSGSLAAYLIGLKFKRFALACSIGVLIAGVIVLTATVSGVAIFKAF